MRATLAQALRADHYGTRREQLADWWLEWPCRHRSFWSLLLLDEGQGWLRWGVGERCTPMSYDPPEPPEYYPVAPPLRRLWFWTRAKVVHPYDVMRGRVHWGGSYSWSDTHYLVDEDRRRELWRR